MELDDLRSVVVYQNSIDVWIAFCQERGYDWYAAENYKKFIAFLRKHELPLKKFPLCVKETGGMFERGKDKTKFAEILSESIDENAAAYTIKLDEKTTALIRCFELS
ncbi:hypothetical protein [Nitrosopumilus sp.]|uniref:hypothetical protein n=1 Tax=Nitrosopumilus sp. TaxID=2024843 RepID=UPI00260C0D0B|nr:hypothetical protein [Nitrosopumilus sp.]